MQGLPILRMPVRPRPHFGRLRYDREHSEGTVLKIGIDLLRSAMPFRRLNRQDLRCTFETAL